MEPVDIGVSIGSCAEAILKLYLQVDNDYNSVASCISFSYFMWRNNGHARAMDRRLRLRNPSEWPSLIKKPKNGLLPTFSPHFT